jgi:hypothetical protein
VIHDVSFPRFPRERILRWSVVIGVAWVVLAIIGWLFQPDKFYQAYLMSWLFWLGVSLGALAVVMLHHLMGGEWGYMVRRLGEHAAMVLPLLIVLFIPIVIGMHSLFIWDRPEVMAHDAVLRHARPYLNEPFFLLRAILYAAIWLAMAWYLRSASLRHDQTGDPSTALYMHNVSAGGMAIYFVTMSLASVDWMMSRDPRWFSTVFGFVAIAGQAISGLCVLLVFFTLMINTPPFKEEAREDHLNDLANILLTFVILWAYMSFVQLLVIWMGNKQDEIPWYVRRLSNGWWWIGLILVVFHFFVPFIILLMRELKRKAPMMLALALALIAMRMLDLFWQTGPSGEDPLPHLGRTLNWMDFVFPVGMGGLWVAMFLWLSIDRPLMHGGDLVPIAKPPSAGLSTQTPSIA